jgi:hypothetical protein
MKRLVMLMIIVLFLFGCSAEVEEQLENLSFEESEVIQISEPIKKYLEPEENSEEPQEFRIEIPTKQERERLPECGKFTTFPVDMNEVRGITSLGNLGPPGHTFPTDHPHLHMGEHGSEKAFEIYAPAEVYLTAVAWGDGMTQDPRDYTVYFALCKDVIGYYNHVKTVSPEIQNILNKVECEDFSSGTQGCTKIFDLDKIEEGALMGTVGLKQGNWDFGLIDLSVNLDFINPERYPERSLHIQCPFDYYPDDMKQVFYDLIGRDDGRCSTTMQDVPGTLKGNWFHSSASESKEVDWDMFLAFVEDYEFSKIQVVSVAGIFTNPGKFEFSPRPKGNINRDFTEITPGEVYCYESEVVRDFQPGASGKILVEMIDDSTLRIQHRDGRCNGNEVLEEGEIYIR